MKLVQLKPAIGVAGEITVVCKTTGKRAIWNDAALVGWVADLDGEPFNAYYSPEGLPRTPEEQAIKDWAMTNLRAMPNPTLPA